MQPAQITANSVSSSSSQPTSLADIEICLRGLTLLRDSFEKLIIQAIPRNRHGQIKEHYHGLAESAKQLLKRMDSVLRQLYDSYVMALKNPSDRHLRSALHELLSEQQQKLVRKIEQLTAEKDKLSAQGKLPIGQIWSRFCGELSQVLVNTSLMTEDYQRDKLQRFYLQQACQAIAQQPLTSKDGKKPSCFISYSWGFAHHTMRVHDLARFLKAAGIEVRLDVWDNKVGSVSIFLDQIQRVDFILLMGSEDLVEKWDNRATSGESRGQTEARYKGHVVADELSRIETRMRREPAIRQSVFPILLSGSHETSLPNAFQDLATAALSLTDSSAFKQVVFELLGLLYRDYPEMTPCLESSARELTRQLNTLSEMTVEALHEAYARLIDDRDGFVISPDISSERSSSSSSSADPSVPRTESVSETSSSSSSSSSSHVSNSFFSCAKEPERPDGRSYGADVSGAEASDGKAMAIDQNPSGRADASKAKGKDGVLALTTDSTEVALAAIGAFGNKS